MPPPGPQSYYPAPDNAFAPPPKRNNRQLFIALGVLALLVIVIVGALAFFRDRIGGDAAALQVGDCIDLPSSEGDFSEVQHQPCNEAHDAEVFLLMTNPAPPGEAYPVVSGFDDYVEPLCVPAFEAYTGRSFESATELTLGYFHPTLTGWGEGDRGFTCHLYRVDGAKMSSSLRVSAPASP